MAIRLRLGSRASEIWKNARQDLIDREGENLELYALQVTAVVASILGFFADVTLGVLLAAITLGIAEVLRQRHARQDLLEAIRKMDKGFIELAEQVQELNRIQSDPDLIAFRESLSPKTAGIPSRPRVT